MTMREVYVFGDSIAYGEWDSKGGWVQRLRAQFDEAYVAGKGDKTRVYNLGITANTSVDLLARMEAEIKSRFNKDADNYVIIAIGMNDAHMVMPADKPFSTPEEFSRNLGRLVGIARGYTRKIALVGLNPIDQRKTDPLPWNNAKAYRSDRVKIFNGVIEKVALETGLFFIDNWKDWTLMDYKPLLCDGLHPNNEGHRRILGRMEPFFARTGS